MAFLLKAVKENEFFEIGSTVICYENTREGWVCESPLGMAAGTCILAKDAADLKPAEKSDAQLLKGRPNGFITYQAVDPISGEHFTRKTQRSYTFAVISDGWQARGASFHSNRDHALKQQQKEDPARRPTLVPVKVLRVHTHQ